MTLIFTGQEVINPIFGVNRSMKDNTGATVVLETTTEAIQDKGWDAIRKKATEKYDSGQLHSNGPPPKVKVVTSDWP